MSTPIEVRKVNNTSKELESTVGLKIIVTLANST